jgi:hypothetical protein
MVLLSNDNPLNIKNYHMLKCFEKKKTNFNVVILPLSKNDLKEQDDISYIIPTLSDTSKQLKQLKQS